MDVRTRETSETEGDSSGLFPLLLYAAGTPNGKKAYILLRELKTTYGLDFEYHRIDLAKNEQKQGWFLKLNPNGRIPVLVDKNRKDFTVFESAAILLYLEQHYDKECKFSFDPVRDSDNHSTMLQWIFWAHGGIGPMQGQAEHFRNAAPEIIPYAIKRYTDETERLYGVLQMRLTDREYLAGSGRGKYSVADINAYPWVAIHRSIGIEALDKWPALKQWFDRLSARPAVQQGMLLK